MNDEWEAALDALREVIDIDPDKGEIFWPIKEGDYPKPNDAYATLYAISDEELDISFYDETGNKLTDEPSVSVVNTYGGGPAHFFYAPLRQLLEKEYKIYVEEDNADCRSARMLARLIKALDEPEADHADSMPLL